jgi:DMSO/TMAO reductase YedYZ molybdopterin-dependent catalytic subunit
MDRRRFFSMVAGAGVGVLLPLTAYRYMMRGMHTGYINVRAHLDDGPQAALRAITPNDDFYLMSSHGEPAVDPEKWSFTIDGLVDHPQRFTYDEIRRLPTYETPLTLECISNAVGGGLIGHALWRGTRLHPLFEHAGIKPQAKYAALYAAEGYTTGHTLERILRPENFLAWEMNGEPLPRRHGFPLRVILPGKYGMKMPKWLTRIEFVNHEFLGYWEWQGWSNSAERQLQAAIDDPRDRVRISGTNFVITGWAVANEAGVSRVEISTDGGRTWNDAPIFSNPMPSQVWAFWKYVWIDPPKGTHTIEVRATDGDGKLQTSSSSGEWPDGATGYHEINVEVT